MSVGSRETIDFTSINIQGQIFLNYFFYLQHKPPSSPLYSNGASMVLGHYQPIHCTHLQGNQLTEHLTWALPQNNHTTVAIGEEELVVFLVPSNFIDLWTANTHTM